MTQTLDPRWIALLDAARAWRATLIPKTSTGLLNHTNKLIDAISAFDDLEAHEKPEGPEYRIALRPYDSHGGAGLQPAELDRRPLDDIVVLDVAMFRAEDMGDHWWVACYMAGSDDELVFDVRVERPNGSRGKGQIVWTAHEFPDVAYETR